MSIDGRSDVLEGVKIIGKVAMTKKRYKCNYIPLIKLSSLLTNLKKGEGILVSVETPRFSIESVMALAKAYEAKTRILSSEKDRVILLLEK